MVHYFTTLTDFSGLVISTWLGIYIITHNRRSLAGWLSAMALWALGGLFANDLLGILSISVPKSLPFWLQLLFPFWPGTAGSLPVLEWPQGRAMALGTIFWYHATTLLRWGSLARRHKILISAAYGLAVLAILVQVTEGLIFTTRHIDPLLVDNQEFGVLYPVFTFCLILFSCLSVNNLHRAARESVSPIVRQQMQALMAASIIVSAAIVLLIIGSIPGATVPTLLITSLLLLTVCVFTYGVVRYSALLDGRVLRRDIIYSAVAAGLAVALYMSVFIWLQTIYRLPSSSVVFLIPLVILSHSASSSLRRLLDRLIYDRRTHDLRARLDSLIHLAGEQADIYETLSRSLQAICEPVLATYGVILVFNQDEACPTGAYRWRDSKAGLPVDLLKAEEARSLAPGSLPAPFVEVTLLVPLYASEKQIGALLLGRPENGIHYSEEDLQLLADPCDRIADLIVHSRRLVEYLDQFVRLPLQKINTDGEMVPTQWVEDALQNLHNYAFLGDSPLVNLKQVEALVSSPASTYLDRGKAVYKVVSGAVEKLRPQTPMKDFPVPREWHPYLILYDAYFEGLPNRDIQSKLYVSEGTFHRTRRSALRSVARVLSELELAHP